MRFAMMKMWLFVALLPHTLLVAHVVVCAAACQVTTLALVQPLAGAAATLAASGPACCGYH